MCSVECMRLYCSLLVCSAFVHLVVTEFCMKSCDILASGSVWGHFFIDVWCFGLPWDDFGRPVSTFDRFLVALGAQNGSLWDLDALGRTFATLVVKNRAQKS